MRILVVEDDKTLAAGLVEGLEREGFMVDRLEAAEPAEAVLQHTAYDLAIVDIGLPGMDGLELIRRVRRRNVLTPILILTARDGLDDRVVGLDVGGDDYLVKPFLLPELLARIRALIRRSRAAASMMLSVGPLALDVQRRSATLAGAGLELTGREWDVLEQLALAAPKVVAKQKLTDSLSQWDKEITPNAVEIYVSRLRSKLASSGVGIRTVRGIGYRIEAGEAGEGDAAPR
ncbi:response regulator [Zoogloea sp. LCSB751]|uniref:response regulator n=1 Tax=Zoogloea sp. LCSB751 TaxID=1965277 RepID=UPI0009A55B68|nr:response regulator [Zoogloea sp. LCSB751]